MLIRYDSFYTRILIMALTISVIYVVINNYRRYFYTCNNYTMEFISKRILIISTVVISVHVIFSTMVVNLPRVITIVS